MADVLRLPKRFTRPVAPDLDPEEFRPAPELEAWARAVFIDETGPLANPRYEHLRDARLGFLWTMVPNSRGYRMILAQAELMPPMAMGKWQKARAEHQVSTWFDGLPDFLLTFDANYARMVDDASFCALVEHELHHCGQQIGADGAPKFRQDGSPAFAIHGHDIEEFIGVVERYGAVAAGVEALVKAAQGGPSVGQAAIAAACGTCHARRRA